MLADNSTHSIANPSIANVGFGSETDFRLKFAAVR
jgi:hypothetical protein